MANTECILRRKDGQHNLDVFKCKYLNSAILSRSRSEPAIASLDLHLSKVPHLVKNSRKSPGNLERCSLQYFLAFIFSSQFS